MSARDRVTEALLDALRPEIEAIIDDWLQAALRDDTRPRWLSPAQAAEYSSLSKSSIHRAISEGRLRSNTHGRSRRIRVDWLDEFMSGDGTGVS